MPDHNDKKAALDRLTHAREALATASPDEHEDLNRAVVEAEKAVPFGRVRGWNFTAPEGN